MNPVILATLKFATDATEDLYNGIESKSARKLIPADLRAVARRKLFAVVAAASLDFLRVPPGNRLEAFTGDRKGRYRVRIDEKYRICFTFESGETSDIEIVDDH